MTSAPATASQAKTPAPYERVEGVHVLRIGGTDYEMGFQHGQLLKDARARESILRRFAAESSWVRGKKVRVEENGGAFEGVTEGLDPRGFLLVRTAKGLETVLSGTVRQT